MYVTWYNAIFPSPRLLSQCVYKPLRILSLLYVDNIPDDTKYFGTHIVLYITSMNYKDRLVDDNLINKLMREGGIALGCGIDYLPLYIVTVTESTDPSAIDFLQITDCGCRIRKSLAQNSGTISVLCVGGMKNRRLNRSQLGHVCRTYIQIKQAHLVPEMAVR